MKTRILIIALIILGTIGSCKKSISSSGVSYLFKATFTDGWLQPNDGEGVIFLSDENGNVLAERTWLGNDSFEMELNEGIDTQPQTINVTTVIKRSNSDRHTITTNMGIPAGTSWTWKGFPSSNIDFDNPPYNLDPDFQNVPDHDGYAIASKWNSKVYYRYTLPSSDFPFYESPMDIYIKLNTTNSGVKYYWLNNVVDGSRTVDLSNMSSASSKTINLNGNQEGYRQYLYGIVNPGQRYHGRYYLDYGRDYNPTNSFQVYYPPSTFTDFRTSIYYYDELGVSEWYQSTYGDIPSTFTKINADFEFEHTSIDNFEISVTGDYTEISSIWRTDNYDYWYVYGDKDDTKYILPELPNSVTQLFDIDRFSFRLWLADLLYWPEITSYNDVIDILFNSSDYFYDVVNELRSFTRYNQDDLGKAGSKEVVLSKDIDREPHREF